MRHRSCPSALMLVFGLTCVAAPATAQQPATPAGAGAAATASVASPLPAYAPARLTAADYARAEQYLAQNTSPLVLHGPVRPIWLSDGRFWYRNAIPEGFEFVVVDPLRATRTRLLEQPRLAEAHSRAADSTYEAFHLPFTQFELLLGGQSIQFDVGERSFVCDVHGNACARAAGGRRPPELAAGAAGVRGNAVISPDHGKAAFIRDWNLWLRDLRSGQETQLTTDGEKDNGYATDNAGWTRSARPILLWSPDSKKIATFQQDERNVGMMYLVDTKVGHPTLQAWRYPLPGDSTIQMISRVIIELEPTPRVIRLKLPPDAHRSTLCDHVACRGSDWTDVEWYPDGSHLAFVSTSRDHKRETLRVADARTGEVRDVYTETVATQYESGTGRANWHVMPATNEFIWFSERSSWGQLYLHDLSTGHLKNAITRDAGTVLQMVLVNERTRSVYFTATGRERGRDPYFRHLYRTTLEGDRVELLTPENADHEVSLSPSGPYFVDTFSRPDSPPTSVLRDATGALLLTLEKGDISRLLATGWTPPLPFTVKGRDGKTDLYGLLFRPTAFDSTRKYPIVDNVYPGPQTGSVGSRSFVASRGDTRALAELGFVVVQLDGMGTPLRSKSFHDAYYGDMGDNTLPDQIAAMRQLAQRYPWVDLERAGIYGHSGGGYAAADAMLRYPDFFRVGISEAGNHDNREYEDDWGERYQGLLTRRSDGSTNYDDQANQRLAGQLKGKLLIAFGTTDDNVPPYNSLLLIDELIKHNRDFDVLPLPNRRHGFGSEPYMVRRRWDYLVKNLLGA
ncbi:MAG TPA: DPP IV N-terminal domain-containing protein, partial [Longimicrobiales bacterium]